jgi:type III pantothenate kinase
MNLLIDVGNQRIKWATSDQLENRTGSQDYQDDQGQWTDQVIQTHTTTPGTQLGVRFATLPAPDAVWVACVSDGRIEQEISGICKSLWGLSPVFARSSASAFGIKNRYQDPTSLGVDRWVAIIAAGNITGGGPILVIDAGTAVTIDYVNARNEFVGGLIFPGLATMVKSLNSSTGLIRENIQPVPGEALEFVCNNTKTAVANGASLSVVAGINMAVNHYLSENGKHSKVLISGGDAEFIAGLSSHQLIVKPDLVLQGLSLLGGSLQG